MTVARRFVLVSSLLVAAMPAIAPAAGAQVPVVFGTSWDAPANSLQNIIDARYGAGNISVTTDYIGADAGDPDPFYWTGLGFTAYLVREVAGHAHNNVLGWYRETGAPPVIDGIDDGIVFNGPDGSGAASMINFGVTPTDFGFWLNPNGPNAATNAPEPELFFSNRFFNDLGPNGAGAIHAPFDGDVQAIVFDVSAWTQPFTWLVCFEDLDYGATPGPCCATTDNDYNDLVFEVQVVPPVPVKAATWTGIKTLLSR
jgi:hypothetical protein